MNPDHPYVAVGMAFAFFLATSTCVVCALFGINEPVAMAAGFFGVGCLSMYRYYRGMRKWKNSSSTEDT